MIVTVPVREERETVEGPASAKHRTMRVLFKDKRICIAGHTAGVTMYPAIARARQMGIRMRRRRLITWEVQMHFANDGGRQKMINLSTIN